MEEKNINNNGCPNETVKKSKKEMLRLLWLAIIAAALSVAGCVLCCLFNEKEEKKPEATKTTVIKTEANAIEFLKNNSNYSDNTFQKLEFNAFWPQEYFEISIKDNTISYWKENNLVAKVGYTKGTTNTLKNINDKEAFGDFPQKLEDLAELVEESYRDEIEKAAIDEDTKNFCLLYNALAGHPESYLLLGRKDESSDWKYYQPSDFPKYKMPEGKNITQFVNQYVQATDSATKAKPLAESFKALVDTISVKAISFDNRGDKIWYGDSVRSVLKGNEIEALKAPYDYTTLKANSACGWIVSKGKEKLEKAKDYYGSTHFIDESTYNKLDNLKWNAPKPEKEPSKIGFVLYIIGCILLVSGILLLAIVITLYVVILSKRSKKAAIEKKYGENGEVDPSDNSNNPVKEQNIKNDKSSKTIEESNKPIQIEFVNNNDASIRKLLDENARLKNMIKGFEKAHKNSKEEAQDNKDYNKLIEAAERNAVEKFKESREYKRAIEKACDEAVEKFKKSDDFKKHIEKADAKGASDGVEKFKESKEYKQLEINAGNWKNFLSCNTEAKVIDFLNVVHDKLEKFPKVNTLSNIYAQASSKNEIEQQVETILAALDKQMGKTTGLLAYFKELVENARYGVDVRARFEKCKEIAQTFGERNEYRQIVSQNHDLTIWERLAVMLWAMECTNEVLKVFGKDHFASATISKAAETHKDDIMQIFATRIFKKFIDDQSVAVGALNASRDKMMGDKLAEMQNKYGVSMAKTQGYNDFVESLDSIHDKQKANIAFINTMKAQFVDEFVRREREMADKGEYLSYVIAMGLHMSDYIRYMNGNELVYCPNMKFVLSGMNPASLDNDSEFRYKDPAFSGDYSNRIYEWLRESGISRLKALVGNKHIMP